MLAAESSRETNSSLVTVKFPRWTLSMGKPTRMIFSAESDCAKQSVEPSQHLSDASYQGGQQTNLKLDLPTFVLGLSCQHEARERQSSFAVDVRQVPDDEITAEASDVDVRWTTEWGA